MKQLIALFASFLLVALPASATVIMTDGTLVTYDPSETYVPSGTLGSDIFSIGFTYTDPTYQNDINLSMPVGMPGTTRWVLTAGKDGTGLIYAGDNLVAGESEVVSMAGFPQASLINPVQQWFSMANFDLPSPIAFGPQVSDSLIDLPGGDIGGGIDPGVSPVPEPSTWGLMGVGLAMLSLQTRRRGRLGAEAVLA